MAARKDSSTPDRKGRAHPARRSPLARVPILARLIARRVEIAPESAANLSAAGMAGFEGIWGLDCGEIVARHADRSVYRITVEWEGRPVVLFVKRLGRAHFKQVFESILRFERPLSKCLKEWRFARLLRAAGVSAPPMLAVGEVRLGPLPLESFLVTREIEGSAPLDEYLAGGGARDAGRRRELIAALAEAVARMHSAGLFHQDLYSKHIFIRREGGKFVINIIDLQRMRKSSRERFAVKDLAALNVTLPQNTVSDLDRLRFLAAYASYRWGGDGLSVARRLLNEVLKRSHHIGGRRKFRGIQWRFRSADENSDCHRAF